MISVVIPTLNEEEFIEKCLLSLSDQTMPRKEFELIVSDSSSTDRTVEIAESIADKVVKCRKISAGFGRNHGAKHAKGKILSFIDADTMANPNYLEGAVESLQQNIAATGPIRSLEKNSFSLRVFYRWWSLQSRVSVMLKLPLFPGFNFAVTKNAFEKTGGFIDYNMTSEDLEYSLRLRKHGSLVFNKKMLVHTSNRRFEEIGLFPYMGNAATFFLFGKSNEWQRHRNDFE